MDTVVVVAAAAAKRTKFDENALNLSLAASESQPPPPLRPSTGECRAVEMRERFQQWVFQAYRDSSKTNTITTKKYERIVKTLAGEIKNCAENSKFRFWMKCKGFRLEAQHDGENVLLVQDKKGDEIKYKKVAVVENFFDIIYNVHVNKGARGIQHAGQKRTHRTITETYAFLPREAVTRFLLFCSECQKRTHDERKTSPNSSSCDSVHEAAANGPVPPSLPPPPPPPPPTRHPTLRVTHNSANQLPLDFSATCREYADCGVVVGGGGYGVGGGGGDDDWKPIHDNNNCADQPYNFCTKRLTSIFEQNEMTRKRKRKFTRKIVRPTADESLEVELGGVRSVGYEEARQDAFGTEAAQDYCCLPRLSYFASPDSAIGNADHLNSKRCKTESESAPANGAQNMAGCPYISRLSEVLYDPTKYAEDHEWHQSTSLNEEFLEQLAVNLIAKARRLEAAKNALTDHERQQVSLKVYSCRVSSFLLNYAADLMLKTVVAAD